MPASFNHAWLYVAGKKRGVNMATPTFRPVDGLCGPIDQELVVAAVLIFSFNVVATLLHAFNQSKAPPDIDRKKTKQH